MWELEYKESWAPKNWSFWTVVLEKTLESPLDCKEIKPVHPKGNQSWIFIWRTDAEAETPILWPPDAKNWLIWKDPDAGKDWRQEEKGMTENEMVGWHHWHDGHEFDEALGVGDGQGSLTCCSPWDHRVGHDWVTELTDWKDFTLKYQNHFICWCYSVTKLFLTLWGLMDCSIQAPLFFTVSWSLLRFKSIESTVLSNHFILCHALLLLPSIFLSLNISKKEARRNQVKSYKELYRCS